MLRLNHPTAPFWLDLGHGVEVEVEPFTSGLMMAARARMRGALANVAPDTVDSDAVVYHLARAAAPLAIRDWRGVGDAAGNPLPVTPDAVSALMDIYQIADAFAARYVVPRLVLDAEKNGSAPAPDGTSAGA